MRVIKSIFPSFISPFLPFFSALDILYNDYIIQAPVFLSVYWSSIYRFIFPSLLISNIEHVFLFVYFSLFIHILSVHVNKWHLDTHGSQSWQPTNPAYHSALPPSGPSTTQASISPRLSISMGQPRPFQNQGQTIHFGSSVMHHGMSLASTSFSFPTTPRK